MVVWALAKIHCYEYILTIPTQATAIGEGVEGYKGFPKNKLS